MLSQVAGEYKEKFEKNNLDLIIKNDVTPVMIQADGRHLWRVFDNLMNNINKYAQHARECTLTSFQRTAEPS